MILRFAPTLLALLSSDLLCVHSFATFGFPTTVNRLTAAGFHPDLTWRNQQNFSIHTVPSSVKNANVIALNFVFDRAALVKDRLEDICRINVPGQPREMQSGVQNSF